jgi:formiminotetrahydrofolate cyclodeaminase
MPARVTTPGNLTTMRDETIGEFLSQLAARMPAPGGGASAALHAAQAAALLAMVARYSDGPAYDEHRDLINGILAEADTLAADSLNLAEADARAFGQVAEAYKLPKDTDEHKRARSAAIQDALGAAARPPADVVRAALRLAQLAEQLLPAGNRNVLTDVAAAAEAARAAASTGAINVEVNLRGIKDSQLREQLACTAALTAEVSAIADRVTAAVRQEISS